MPRAWNKLGYEQKRKQEAKKALDLSTDLPRVERMQVEADYYESLPNHEKAAFHLPCFVRVVSRQRRLRLAACLGAERRRLWKSGNGNHFTSSKAALAGFERSSGRHRGIESAPAGHEKAVVLLHNAEQKSSSQ